MFHPDGPTFLELARQALSSTEHGYDLLAPKFDFTPFRTPDVILKRVVQVIAEEPWERALDLCCGSGAVMQHLKHGPERVIVGLDNSRGMLLEAKKRLQHRDVLVRADALRPPFGVGFDLVTCFGALGHFVGFEHRSLVRSVKTSLRPGGRFVFTTAEHPSRWSRSYWLSKSFNSAMRVRNALLSPPFIMYYLTFMLPEATRALTEEGFELDIRRELFEKPFARLCLVIAKT